ncbi:phosphodiester glycosidase family protein [Actinopolymorpha sp. B11F2]|uniref:phosphodiester glycosidase family protein n=1 Tax=Actinopolymorpha sp. B11F2 TaxID=3160862 RepID=UPI0032E4B1C6
MSSTATSTRTRRLAPATAIAAAALLLLGLVLPGGTRPAAAGPPDATPAPLPDLRSSTSDAARFDLDAPRSAPKASAAVEPRMETYERQRPVAPGVTLRSFDRYGPDGFTGTPTWLQADSLTVDLTKGTVPGYLFPGQVAKGEPISVQANRVGAVAAVNGDFFDINNSTAPLGVGIRDGEVIQSPDTNPTWHKSAAILTPDGLGRIGEVLFNGTIALPDGASAPLAGINKPTLAPDAIEAFTPLWGTYCRCRATQDAAKVTEVEVVDGTVTAVRPQAGEGAIPAGGFVLVGREAGADALAGLAIGDAVSIDYAARTADEKEIRTALNGRQLLVVDGVPQKASQGNNVPPAPRTAVGFSADGTKMYVLTADGRQPAFADGLGLDELATMMVELGAHNAVNLDGGGSTTMVARTPGATTAEVENRPSDGRERSDPNGLALFAPEGSKELHGLWVETALDPDTAAGSSSVAPARPDRVFPGLTRRLTATGYDETYGPADGDPTWTTDEPKHGTVNGDGVFHAGKPGRVTVEAYDGSVRGTTELHVLGPLARLSASTQQVAIVDDGGTARFGVVGQDAGGYTAPIEPGELTLSYDDALIDITPDSTGQFTVTAKQPRGSTQVVISATTGAGKVSLTLPVTVGLDEIVVSDFEDPSVWSYFGERATGSIAPAPGKVGQGLALTYNFDESTATRTGGALATDGIEVPGQPRELRLWVHSSGHGEWASLQAYDGTGALLPAFRAGYLTSTGWQQLSFSVPAGTQYPLTIRRYYSAETKPEAQYKGELIIDELTALVPPEVEVPPAPKVEDPLIVQNGTVDGAPWTFAVMSDAQFVARDPDSALVRQARRTLREIRASDPDFLLINGDLVDEASPEDFALATRILDEDLEGELPYYYVPGNHEVMGGSIDNFTAAFGETSRVFDHKGTRFITINTSALSIRGSDWTQLRTLRQELDKAAQDRGVGSVALVQHVPLRDPTPAKASELSDRKEAAVIESWLSDFQRSTGKGAVFIGAHVGTFHAAHVDGVPAFVNGNSAKSPATAPADGGVTGWSRWGVDPVTGKEADAARDDPLRDAPEWIAAEVRPHVDALELAAPGEVGVGESVDVKALLTQGEETFPVGYPMTASWSGSPNVLIGDESEREVWHAAVFDPRTGTLTAWRPASIRLAVTVNGTSTDTTIRLSAQAAA